MLEEGFTDTVCNETPGALLMKVAAVLTIPHRSLSSKCKFQRHSLDRERKMNSPEMHYHHLTAFIAHGRISRNFGDAIGTFRDGHQPRPHLTIIPIHPW